MLSAERRGIGFNSIVSNVPRRYLNREVRVV
jgi:hypothetical protein